MESAEEVARTIQRRVGEAIRRHRTPDMSFRIRDKLARWQLPGRPRALADAYTRQVNHCRRSVPPRVRAAMWNTAWNRWVTERRLQRRGSVNDVCVFGCPPAAEDNLEHYSRCRVLRAAHQRHLRLQPPHGGTLLQGWLLGADSGEAASCTRWALGAYASYRCYCSLKLGGGIRTEEVDPMFGQYLREGASGHAVAEKALATTWVRHE